jgi:membrane fusion protein, multidrug efflux system
MHDTVMPPLRERRVARSHRSPESRRRPHHWRATVLLAGIAMLAGCARDDVGAGAGRGDQRATPVVIAAVIEQPWSDIIEALGTARARESVTLTAKVTETVDRVAFDDGDYAEEGQVLVDLSGRAEVASLEEAQANYTEALKQYQRLAGLVEQGTVPRSQLDNAVASRDAARARMNAIRARLADRVITAPFAGVLGFRRVSPGTLVTPGTEIATLDDVSMIKLDFSVPETFLGQLAPGQSIQARSAAWPENTFDGTVRTLDSRVDPVSRAITVRADLPNPQGLLRPGMLLTVRLQQAPRTALVIPELALVQVGSTQSVFRVGADDTVEQVPVQSGMRRRGEVEIVAGLRVGDRIVVEGVGKLRPGARVVDTRPAVDLQPAA